MHLYVSVALERLGRYDQALARARVALRLTRSAGQPQSLQAEALNQVGWFLAKLGRYRRALCYCQQAVALTRHLGHTHAYPSMLDSLAYVYWHLGRKAGTSDCYRRAVELYDELGYRHRKAETLTYVGDAYRADGNLAAARQAWTQALAILDDLHDPDAATIRAKLTPDQPEDPVWA